MADPITNPYIDPKAPSDLWSGATFYDVTLVQMIAALIASGKYAPGTLLMELALAATAQIMVQTGRVPATLGIDAITLDATTFPTSFNRL